MALAQPAQKCGGTKMVDFSRITLFCLEKLISKHKNDYFSKNSGRGVMAPLASLGYAYATINTNFEAKQKIAFLRPNLS